VAQPATPLWRARPTQSDPTLISNHDKSCPNCLQRCSQCSRQHCYWPLATAHLKNLQPLLIPVGSHSPYVEATIGNNSITVSRRAGEEGRQTWQSDPFALPGTGSFPLEIRWYDRSRSRELILAEYGPLMLSNSSDRNIVIRESEYRYNFDQDGDGSSNIAEIRNQTDPFVAESPGNENDQPSLVDFNVLVSAPPGIQAAPFVDASQLQADVVFIVSDSPAHKATMTMMAATICGNGPLAQIH